MGFEYNPGAREIAPLVNWVMTPETKLAPLVAFNVSSDRIGTPKGPLSYGITLAKGFPSLHVAPYITLRYSEYERGVNYPFGMNIQLAKDWSLLPMNDGRRSHLLLTRQFKHASVSLMYIWFRHPGISTSFGF